MADPTILQPGSYTLAPGTTITLSTPALVPPAPVPVIDPTAMPIGNLPSWRQIYHEDFLRPAALGQVPTVYADTLACYPKPWVDTTQHGAYDPGILEASNSCLRAHLGWNATLGKAAVATVGPLLPGGGAQTGQLYHRHAVRFRILPGPAGTTQRGLKAVFLLWPDKKQTAQITSADGELDWPEASLGAMMQAFTHYTQPNPLGVQQSFATGVAMSSGWHIVETAWGPLSVEYFLDGVRIGVSSHYLPTSPMHLELQLESATDGSLPGPGSAAIVEYDWMTVYSYDTSVQ